MENIDNVKIRDIKMDVRAVIRCFKKYGIIFDREDLKCIFGSESRKGQKSCKVLRNEVLHSLKKSACCEIVKRDKSLNDLMGRCLRIIGCL